MDTRSLFPSRLALPEGVLLLLLALVSVNLAVEVGPAVRWLAVGFLAVTLFQRAWNLVPVAILLLALLAGEPLYPSWVWEVPTAPFLFPFLLAFAISLPFPALRAAYGWFRLGEPGQIGWCLVALVSLVAGLALALWALWADHLGLASGMLGRIRSLPFWFMLLVAIPGFALLNAFAEEVVYRGMIQGALERCLGGFPALVLVAQASAFAAAHYYGGFPNGKLGYLMTFVYALMLGGLKRYTGGMLAPYVAHVAADLVIGATLLLLAY